ncbi:MAG TPA: ribokinase [Terrimesophilobacter sp.]|uniref:ribokinase n=1 Tax=Terrimesophilobacter sp. TaxID=2906435 RepID=UPI002F94D962
MVNGAHSGIAMVGSANMDVVFSVERIPRPGETLLATSTAKYPGGKGLNQAVAAARAGAATTFVGALGTDDNGTELAETMHSSGIDGSLVRRSGEASGQAFIVVADNAENTIIVASGANAEVTALSPAERDAVSAAAVLLMQLELPIGVVIEAAQLAREAGTTVMLNAAPARELPDELIASLDYLIVNEHEACLIGGTPDLAEASKRLAAGVNRLIVTLGSDGSVLYDGGREVARVSARTVVAIDTTGAGDTYCGAFAAAVEEGQDFAEAAEFATAAAALSVQALGAVPSIPERDRILAFLAEQT